MICQETKINEERLASRFDCYCKKIIRNARRDVGRKHKRQWSRELAMSALCEDAPCMDIYPSDSLIVTAGEHHCTVGSPVVYRCLMVLPEREREALVLKYFYKWKDEQIANYFDVTTRTVRDWRKRAIQIMRDRCAKELIDDEAKG